MLQRFAGRRVESDVTPVVVILTDGRASAGHEPADEAQELMRDGVSTFVIGVGVDVDDAQLRTMVSNDNHIFHLKVPLSVLFLV